MPSFFSPSPRHGAVISSVAFAIRSFTSVSYNTFVPFWGTVLAHLGQARYPTWASTLPHLGTFAARMLPICPQYGRLRLGFLKKTEFHLSSCCFRRTMSICPSPDGEGQILCFVKDCWMQVTLVNDKSPIIRLLWVIIRLLRVIIKLPWVIIR